MILPKRKAARRSAPGRRMGRDHREWQKVFSRALRAQGNLLRRMVQARRAKFREQRRLCVSLSAGVEEGRAALRRQLCVGAGAVYRVERDEPRRAGADGLPPAARCAGGRGAELSAGRGEGGGAPRLGERDGVCLWPGRGGRVFGRCDCGERSGKTRLKT